VGGLAFAFAFPAKQALLVQVSPPRWLGSIQGIEQGSMQGAAFIGTLVAPLVYGAIGGWVFAVCGGVALAGVAVATPILGRHWACIRDGARHCADPAGAAEPAAIGATDEVVAPGTPSELVVLQEAPTEADAG
jgi:MFS family permease